MINVLVYPFDNLLHYNCGEMRATKSAETDIARFHKASVVFHTTFERGALAMAPRLRIWKQSRGEAKPTARKRSSRSLNRSGIQIIMELI